MAERLISSVTILTATAAEAEGLRRLVGDHPLEHLQIDFLVSGVSMVNTSYCLGRYLANSAPDMLIQIGIAGSFSEQIPIGSVVEVTEELFPELGAESPEGWLSLEQLGFPLVQTAEGNLYNRLDNPVSYCSHLTQARAITVNNVSGIDSTIERLKKEWNPDIESMEGGAFFHAMKQVQIPFMQLRGISNMVEPRNKERWRIGAAINAVQKETFQFLAEFLNN